MARPEAFVEANATFIGPEGAGLLPLPAHRTETTVVTCWRLNPLEVQEVLDTGRIWVHVVGSTVLPMAVNGHNPFGEVLPPGHVLVGEK